jgi:transglutaminase-like putative cysteine protease
MSAALPASYSTTQWRPGPPLLGLMAGWVALFAWSGMVAEPLRFLVPTLIVGLVMALAGSALRVVQVPAYGVASVQVLIALLSLNTVFGARESLLGIIPTPGSVRHVVYVINNGANTLNHYSAPVEVNPTHTQAMLMACGLAVLLAIDVLAMGLRRAPLVALPLLITLSVPVSILRDALALPVFVGTSLLFLRLLATEHLETFGSWGFANHGVGTGPGESSTSRPILATMWQVSIVAVLVALLAAPLVPVSDLLDRDDGGGAGAGGAGGNFELTAVNPFIRLRRDLVEKTHTPLVYAQTESRTTSYLRTTVLDELTNDEWRPSPRNLPEGNDADGTFPNPPGLAVGIGGFEDEWTLQLARQFSTTWLPLPYPIRKLDLPGGGWRYDSRTLDVAYVQGGAPSELRYRATAFTPSITAQLLDSTVKAPTKLRRAMTALPDDLPDVIGERAEEVTRGATTSFAKAVALQDWFRDKGGFRYSLEQRGGSGMDLLASFVTDDRVGYCEQFAAAMAAMGRTLGIPSRVVVGFLDGVTQTDGRILYTSDDRHAWPEMYFSGVGWVRFEPTPSQRAGATPNYTRQDATPAEPSAAPSGAISQGPAAERDQAPSDVDADTDQGVQLPAWPLLALLVVATLGLAPGLLRRFQRRRRLATSDPVHLAEGAWAELRATALDLGLDWPEQRSPREQARSVTGQVRAEDDDLESLEGLLLRVERGRYARTGPGSGGTAVLDAEERQSTVRTVDAWRRVMAGSVDRERSWRGRLWPVSLLRRRP